MYVCLCKGVTDHQIKSAIAEGATSVSQLRKCLGVASQCGKCGITTREILQQQLANETSSTSFGNYYALV